MTTDTSKKNGGNSGRGGRSTTNRGRGGGAGGRGGSGRGRGRGRGRASSSASSQRRRRHHGADHARTSEDATVATTASSSPRTCYCNDQKSRSKSSGGDDDRSYGHHKSNDSKKKKGGSNATGQKKKSVKEIFAQHMSLQDALKLYADHPDKYIRGKLRVLGSAGQRIKAFVSCDRGGFRRDVIISGVADTNRALDGDVVFVEIIGPAEVEQKGGGEEETRDADARKEDLNADFNELAVASDADDEEEACATTTWRDDTMQRTLWDPVVDVQRHASIKSEYSSRHGSVLNSSDGVDGGGSQQMRGRVVHVCAARHGRPRIIVGTLKRQSQGQKGKILLVPSNRALPYFVVPRDAEKYLSGDADDPSSSGGSLYKAEYSAEAWMSGMRFPPCRKVQAMGNCFDPEDETQALLTEHDVNHGEFEPSVLRDVEQAVKSGRTKSTSVSGADGADGEDLGWAPTKSMYKGRKDYRDERIFTIDPTTAKDLDDALHIKPLPNNQVEIGVHIADVSHFVKPHSHVDKEASYRATTVYLVDRTVPMLPRPLCEIACSLNENVERLAFSCVWVMNMDGTMAKEDDDNSHRGQGGKGRGKKGKREKVWYGRTVIKSCARLDYNTAQNIIDGKCGNEGQTDGDMSEELWPQSRRPTGGHTIMQVANDVRLMHKVAMARRRLRFDNGALALHGVKLVFRLEDDNKTPKLCEPYPIKDSNRLVEEYMLMANYLVAQRLITHAGGLALLRQHPPPLEQGLDEVAQVAEELGFKLDATNSASIQNSLRRISRECTDDVILQGVTELLMAPMQPAEYIAAGKVDDSTYWRHFALNIPYYTHFTSPIRRYADVIVHRLLQATLDGPQAVQEYYQSMEEIGNVASHCNDKRMGSKKAQERSDRVFLSLYLRDHPIKRVMAIVTSVGEKSFTVFVPSLGLTTKVNLEEHEHLMYEPSGEVRKIITVRCRGSADSNNAWTGGSDPLEIRVFAKICVSCTCKLRSPIDVNVTLVGPWAS